ncbi:MAG: transposase [Meiothermus ruber]|uniref:transposase n=1 Tax=Meiothermus ruber TaxID=277 RepID=UPI0023F6E04C|nr:transposase [Meiothermus ruber]MCL6530076.1 transposase [Meiothermus ruber]
MKRVPPFRIAEEAVREVLRRGSQGEEHVAGVLMRLGLEALVNRVLEEERTDFLGRERYERVAEEEKRGHRNGYKPGYIHTAEGRVGIAIPQVRDTDEPFHPQSLAAVRGRTEEMERLVVEMYARGLSTRDIEDAFRDPETGRWQYTEPDWNKLYAIATGNGPASKERLAFRRLSYAEGAWVREAVLNGSAVAA